MQPTHLPVATPFARPFYMMAKPAGSMCNLACEYCYYLEKKDLYDSAGRQLMSYEVLENFIRQYIEAQTGPQVQFTWHGGEALLRPLEFYQKAVDLQHKYAGGRQIDNSLQTNGLLLTDEWCRFLKEHNWLVGLSIDGPARYHDEYRRDRADNGSFQRVMRAATMLNRYGIEWNAMAVVNDYNADHPLEFYNFFRTNGCRFLQFTPIVERLGSDGRLLSADGNGEMAPFSITPQQWGDFLIAVFDRWVRTDVGTMFVQIFDSTLANWAGELPGVCVYAPTCGHAGIIEHNGDVYSCDHFVFPEYRLGNIASQTLVEMMYSPRQRQFGADKRDKLPGQCRECRFLFACNGECPKNRFATTPQGEPGLNYLCEGYRRFFSHVAPYMDFMKNELDNKRPPANVMRHVEEIRAAHNKK